MGFEPALSLEKRNYSLWCIRPLGHSAFPQCSATIKTSSTGPLLRLTTENNIVKINLKITLTADYLSFKYIDC